MNAHLNYMLAQQRIADLQRNADRARLASEVDARRRGSLESNPITRLNARISRLTPRRAPTGLRNANDPARPPAPATQSSTSAIFLTETRIDAPELSYFTDIDHRRHEAVAAIDQRDGSIVGVGRYVHVADRPKVADLAVEVTDELQNMGIGTALFRYTVQRARENRFALLTATTLWENRPARALLRRFEFHAYASDGSEIELELKLDSPGDGPKTTPAIERTQPRNVFRVNQNIRPYA